MPSESKRACDCCNIRKIKCDGTNPCSRCVAAGIACTSLRERKKSGPRNLRQAKVKILKQQQQQQQQQRQREAQQQQQQQAASTTTSLAQYAETTSSSSPTSHSGALSVSSPQYSSSLSSASDLSISAATAGGAFALDDQSLIFTGTVLPAPAWDLHRISWPVLQTVLLLYKEKLYGIWPLLHAEDLITRLQTESNDPELYALATALCAATLSYLDCTITHESVPEPLLAETFVSESRRVRATFNYMEPVGRNTVLTSYFLHMHYGKQPSRSQMAAFYIREAITFAHLLGLHNESTYAYSGWAARDRAAMRRLYFLLFMTERYLCIQRGLPTVLESISLPEVLDGDEQFPDVVGGFLNLITLFSTPGSNFYGKWTSHASDVSISREQLLLIQRALQRPLFDAESVRIAHERCQDAQDSSGNPIPCPHNPIQLVDIVVSQHWIRSLAWKLSILLGYVTPAHGPTGSSSNALSVAYPLEIAGDTLRGIQIFHKDAFEVHGPGMEVKMCEIASALADSILCSPPDSVMGLGYSSREAGAKSLLKGLADRIFEMRTMNSSLRDELAGKLEVVLKCSDIPPNMPYTQEADDAQEDDVALQYLY